MLWCVTSPSNHLCSSVALAHTDLAVIPVAPLSAVHPTLNAPDTTAWLSENCLGPLVLSGSSRLSPIFLLLKAIGQGYYVAESPGRAI